MKLRISNAGEMHDMELPITLSEVPITPTHPTPKFTGTLNKDTSTTLAWWDTDGASGIYLNDKPEEGPSKSIIVKPAVETKYVLRVIYPGESDVYLQVIAPKYAPVIPPVTTKIHIGINSIGNTEIPKQDSEQGCKIFLIIDNPTVCEQIAVAHPDAYVINRRYISNWQFTGEDFWNRYGAAGHGVWNEIFNEQDNWPYGTVKEITDRINFELDYMHRALNVGARVLLGGYSMGTPEFLNPDICHQVARYAPYVNGDPHVAYSCHNYSPNMTHIDLDNELKWYERRWEFLYTDCEFDPTNPIKKIIFSETGVDEYGTGGFSAHNATPDQFRHWCQRTQEIQARPVVVNGVSYPSPVIGGAIFNETCGSDAHWAGYDICQYHAVLQEFWK